MIIAATARQFRTGSPPEIPFIITDNAIEGDQGYQHNYVGTWSDGAGISGWYEGTLSYSNTTNDYVEYKFNGTQIEWFTETKNTHGIVAVSIDGGAETDVDLYAASATTQVLVWTSPALTQAVHTIKLRVTGTKNPSSSQYYAITDYFKVYNPGIVPETPDPEPYDLFVTTTGSNGGANDCHTEGSPCLTLVYAITQATSGEKIKLGAGTFTETSYIVVPTGISIWGDGLDATTIKLNSSLNHTASFDLSKCMFQYSGGTGNQTLKDLSIEGNAKLVNGGIYVNRNNVDFDNIRISNFDRFGLYQKGTDNSITNSFIINSSWASSFSLGAIMVAGTTNFIINNTDINEGEGYAVKAFETQPIINGLIIENSYITVTPLDGNGLPNISIELHDCFPRNSHIRNNTIEGNVSLVHPTGFADDGVNSVKVHNNIIDMKTRHNTNQACIEWIMHNVEIDSNYLYTAKHSVVYNFGGITLNPPVNLKYHHNIAYLPNLTNTNPTGGIRSNNGFNGAFIYNNVWHIPPGSNQTFATVFSGTGAAVNKNCVNVQFKNNIVYDQSTADGASGANAMIRREGTGSYSSSTFSHNIINGMPVGAVAGVTYSNNLTGAPGLTGSGVNASPFVFYPFYLPAGGSIAIDAGIDVGFPYNDAAPDIGRYETD